MWFKIKISRKEVQENGKEKNISEIYLTEALHFADAGYKIIQEIGTEAEVEDVCMMKNLKPAANTYNEDNKIYIVKVAQDFMTDDGSVKTIKYPMPVFANSNDDLQKIMKDFISQGMDDMRLTTISETKWKLV